MSLEIIEINEVEKWDNIVKSFKDYDVYYLNGYVSAFKLHGDGEPLLIYFNNNITRAINVVIKRDISQCEEFKNIISENTYFDFSTPYGYGGFIVEGSDIEQINNEYSEYCIKNNIICEVVRYHPVLCNSYNTNKIYDVKNIGTTVTIDTSNYNEIWNNITSKNRNMIRKAKKNNIKIYWGRDDYLIDEFMQIYNSTMDKDNAKLYYYFERDFYKSILNDLKYNAQFFYAKLDNEIISMSIILFANNKVHYHLSGSKRDFQHLAPTNLLLYEVACWSCMNGYKSLHLGGGLGAKEDSLYKFKKSFYKGDDTRFDIGKKIYNVDLYNELVDIASKNKSLDENYFPLYRS